jgi:hypothetical protein
MGVRKRVVPFNRASGCSAKGGDRGDARLHGAGTNRQDEPLGGLPQRFLCVGCHLLRNADGAAVNAGARLHRFPEQRCINDGGVKVTEARRLAPRPPSRERRSMPQESAPFGQGRRASLLVDLPRDEMALLIELVVHLGMN